MSEPATPLLSNDEKEEEHQSKSESTRTEAKNQEFQERNLKDIFSGLTGNVIEYYDFSVYGYISDTIGDVFFPDQDGNDAIFESFLVFGSAFLMRPLGGLISGYIGDKFGRKRALEFTLILMAFPTLALGCLPTYDQVGWVAILLLSITRLLQGIAQGGQMTSSLVFTLEGRQKNEWGFYSGLVLASTHTGSLIGSLFGYLLKSVLTDDQMETFGWRLPFLCGIVLFIPTYHIKYHAKDHELPQQSISNAETDQVAQAETEESNKTEVQESKFEAEESKEKENPIKKAFAKENRRSLLSVILISMVGTGTFYLSFVWMAIYMDELLDPPVDQAFLINSLALAFSHCFYAPVAGILSDKYGRLFTMIPSLVGIALLGPLTVWYASTKEPAGTFFIQCSLGIVLTTWLVSMWVWLVESFPPEIRLTAVAVGYNFSSAVVGGFTPALATWMVDHTGLVSPAFIFVGMCCAAFLGIWISPMLIKENEEQKGDEYEVDEGGEYNLLQEQEIT